MCFDSLPASLPAAVLLAALAAAPMPATAGGAAAVEGPFVGTLPCADRADAHLDWQTEPGRIEATLEPDICRDTMADAAYGDRARVTVADAMGRTTFRGCAWLGAGTTPP